MSYVDLSDANIEETAPGAWVAFGTIGIVSSLPGWRQEVARLRTGEFEEISVDDAIAELTRRGEMTGHEAIAARRRAIGGAA